MEQCLIDRLNELARKSRDRGLTDEEAAEQKALRAAYIGEYRAALTETLDSTYILRPDGTKEKLMKKNE